MIKANELRIGNYVEWNKKTFKCCQIFSNSIENELWCKPLNELHGIKLSQEILLNFGFKLNEDTSIWHLGCYQIYENDLGHFEFCFFRYGEWQQPIEYVHELQNLFFCVSSGEELVFSTEP